MHKKPIHPKSSFKLKHLTHAPVLPESWSWWVDDLIPGFVKENYSPKEHWKKQPFQKDDFEFFFKGINELSDLFTVERGGKIPPYFRHERFRSAYFLYFLPLQTAKFLLLYQMHSEAMKTILESSSKNNVLRIADLGAGPGTASLSLLLWLLEEKRRGTISSIPFVEFTWLDTEKAILEDGKRFLEKFTQNFPAFQNKISVTTHVSPWWNAPYFIHKKNALILMGNVLNENVTSLHSQYEKTIKAIQALLETSSGAGLLFLELASHPSSQFLSRIRDQIITPATPTSFPIWGPCLHAENCPLSKGRDWCHFSVPAILPGNWFKMISRKLGSVRNRLKFSYLWISSRDYPAPTPKKYLRRVVSDLITIHSQQSVLLLCEPERVRKIIWKPSDDPTQNPYRGDQVECPSSDQNLMIKLKD